MSIFRRIGIWLGLIKPTPTSHRIVYRIEFDSSLIRAEVRYATATIKLEIAARQFAAVVLDALQNG